MILASKGKFMTFLTQFGQSVELENPLANAHFPDSTYVEIIFFCHNLLRLALLSDQFDIETALASDVSNKLRSSFLQELALHVLIP